MENLDIAKNIATIATPLTKVVMNTWLAPKLAELKKKEIVKRTS